MYVVVVVGEVGPFLSILRGKRQDRRLYISNRKKGSERTWRLCLERTGQLGAICGLKEGKELILEQRGS